MTARSAARRPRRFGEAAEPGLAEALALLVELRHQGREGSAPAGASAEPRAAGAAAGRSRQHQGRQAGVHDQPRLRRIERRGALVGNDADEARLGGKQPGRRGGGLAVALDPVEDAAAELAPGSSTCMRPCRRTGATRVPEAKRSSTSMSGSRPPRSKWSEPRGSGSLPGGAGLAASTSSSAAATARRPGVSATEAAPASSGALDGSSQVRRISARRLGQADHRLRQHALHRLQRHDLSARRPARRAGRRWSPAGRRRELGRAGPAHSRRRGAARPCQLAEIDQPAGDSGTRRQLPAAERRTWIRSPSTVTSTGEGQAALPAGRGGSGRSIASRCCSPGVAIGRDRRKAKGTRSPDASTTAGRAGRAAPHVHKRPQAGQLDERGRLHDLDRRGVAIRLRVGRRGCAGLRPASRQAVMRRASRMRCAQAGHDGPASPAAARRSRSRASARPRR